MEEEGTPEEPSPEITSSLPRRQRTTSTSTDVSDTGGITPTRRNKRKMTAPKRRSDFSIKRFCPDLSDGRSDEEEEDEEDGEDALEDFEKIGRQCRLPKRPMVVGGSTGSSPNSRRDTPPSSGEGPNSPGISMVTAEGLPIPVVHMNSRVQETTSAGIGGIGGGMAPCGPPHHVYGPAHLQSNQRHFMSNSNRLPTVQGPPHPNNLIPGASARLALPMPPQSHGMPSESPSPGSFPIPSPPSPADSTSSMAESGPGGKKTRKNYKNMTRERRVEANARERSRVHTISAAFESLRRAVPSYSYNQKLSKLAILRIACSYILSLAKLADMDYSDDHRNYSFADCVDMCTRVIQTEGRARRRH